MEEVADAIQTACKRFLEHAEGISEPGQIYSWIRTTAHRVLQREDERHGREEPRKSIDGLAGLAAEEPGPAEELISSEDDADLAELVEEVYSSLPDRGRDILALYGAGYKRPQIAERLGLSDRVVKRELLEVMDAARSAVARLAGGGCRHGEPLVLRSVCGLATAAEDAHACEHLARCGRCEIFSERLIAWREKAGGVVALVGGALALRASTRSEGTRITLISLVFVAIGSALSVWRIGWEKRHPVSTVVPRSPPVYVHGLRGRRNLATDQGIRQATRRRPRRH
jgi:RNA polymerase sigma factor (sigma-70 family)